MNLILLVIGLLTAITGLILIGLGLPVFASNLGSMLVTTGTIAAVGGLILIGLAAVVQQLYRLAHALEGLPLPRSLHSQENLPPSPSAVPSSWLTAQSEESGKDSFRAEDAQSTGLAAALQTRAHNRENSDIGDSPNFPHAPEESGLARAQKQLPPEPLDIRNSATQPDIADDKAIKILKSGVIDGMAYTLYVDGSIEAELPRGTVRFGSLDELRDHLARRG
jgi:hypothetical protein